MQFDCHLETEQLVYALHNSGELGQGPDLGFGGEENGEELFVYTENSSDHLFVPTSCSLPTGSHLFSAFLYRAVTTDSIRFIYLNRAPRGFDLRPNNLRK